jgi:hypothetical protein
MTDRMRTPATLTAWASRHSGEGPARHALHALKVRLRAVCPPYAIYAGRSVVGSIMVRIAVIFVAGKPLISACLRMTASSLAR